MKYACSSLPEIFYLTEGPEGFEKGLKLLDEGDWVTLYECLECGALWAIDAWDKYRVRFAYRLKSREAWPTTIPVEKQKELLLASRSGTTDEICIWEDCGKHRVKGVVYCIDHLYETGARK